MARAVALEAGLEHIGKFLEAQGYKVVPLNSSSDAVDAVVYSGRKLEEIYNNTYNQKIDPVTGNMNELNPYGVLLVNAQGKTPEQVYWIIQNRVYEHII